MRCVKSLIAVGAASLLSSVAFAADVPITPPPGYGVAPPPPGYGVAPPPPGYAVAPPPVGYVVAQPPVGYGGAQGVGYGGAQAGGQEFNGWYLRGDISFNHQGSGRLQNALDTGLNSQSQNSQFSSANSYSMGGGFKFNDWLRGDFTGEFRGSSQFSGSDRITYNGGVGMDIYRANVSEWVVMGNFYVDLGTWWSFTPFIGAGVGGARVSIANFIDQGIANNGNGSVSSTAFSDNSSRWNLAWALHAGIGYKLAQNFTIELAYRYLDMGDGLSGDIRTFDGINNIVNPMTFKNLHSHDLKFGVRWEICPPVYPPVYAPAYAPGYAPSQPLIRKG